MVKSTTVEEELASNPLFKGYLLLDGPYKNKSDAYQYARDEMKYDPGAMVTTYFFNKEWYVIKK